MNYLNLTSQWKHSKSTAASVSSVNGFEASGVACGIKSNNAADLALIHSTVPAIAAGVFTTNIVKGDSLIISSEKVKAGKMVRALLINSGNANACVGDDGRRDATQMAAITATVLGISESEVLCGSTGVIGRRLPMEKVEAGIKQAAAELAPGDEAGHLAMQAIMTTDTVPKESVYRVEGPTHSFSIAGMAKGSGMIHPNMATMIAVITTDAPITKECLQEALSLVTNTTFNRTSVDGDTSVCDMVVAMSSRLATGDEISDLESEAGRAFTSLLSLVCYDLAREIARDGEGASRLIHVLIDGANSADDAYLAALAVARSPLVKTAIFGADANWGRILTAVGYSGASFDPKKADVWIGDILCCEAGTALDFDEDAAKKALLTEEVTLRVNLNAGNFSDHYWTCDFSYDYIKINGSYRT